LPDSSGIDYWNHPALEIWRWGGKGSFEVKKLGRWKRGEKLFLDISD
jgi:hypothetical protein